MVNISKLKQDIKTKKSLLIIYVFTYLFVPKLEAQYCSVDKKGQDTIVQKYFPIWLQGRTLDRAKVFTMDNEDFEVIELTFFKDSISYKEENSEDLAIMNIKEINKVQVYTGNEAGVMGFFGAALGGAIDAFMQHNRIKSNKTFIENPNLLEYLVCIIVGGAIGAIVGSQIKNWVTVYTIEPPEAPEIDEPIFSILH